MSLTTKRKSVWKMCSSDNDSIVKYIKLWSTTMAMIYHLKFFSGMRCSDESEASVPNACPVTILTTKERRNPVAVVAMTFKPPMPVMTSIVRPNRADNPTSHIGLVSRGRSMINATYMSG